MKRKDADNIVLEKLNALKSFMEKHNCLDTYYLWQTNLFLTKYADYSFIQKHIKEIIDRPGLPMKVEVLRAYNVLYRRLKEVI